MRIHRPVPSERKKFVFGKFNYFHGSERYGFETIKPWFPKNVAHLILQVPGGSLRVAGSLQLACLRQLVEPPQLAGPLQLPGQLQLTGLLQLAGLPAGQAGKPVAQPIWSVHHQLDNKLYCTVE